jgi:Uma2 family endonuclease
MVSTGVLVEDDPIELLNGIMVWKMPQSPQHFTVTRRSARTIERVLPPGWHVRTEGPVRIPDYDEPEPDIAVVRGEDGLYEKSHPGPGDIALIIEVAESSLSRDRGEKRDIYARAGIPAYWIINPVDRQIEIHGLATGAAYPPPTVLKDADSVELMIDGQVVGWIAVADLIPRP